MKQDKLDNLVKYSVSTFENNNAEDVQSNARKSAEAFCKFIILHHYGEEKGKKIIYSQDREFNKDYRVTKNQKKRQQEFVLSMLNKIISDPSILERCYKKKYQGVELSKVVDANKVKLKININMLIFNGNSSSHESSPIEMTSTESNSTQGILDSLLYWLFTEYLETNIPSRLVPFIARYDIFLSYRHTNKAWRMILEENLKAQGFSIFIDSYQLIAGENLEQQLRKAIDKSSCGVIISSVEDNDKWVRDELKWMEEKKQRDSNFKIIPIVIDGSSFKLKENIVYVDFTKKPYQEAFNDLVCAIKREPSNKNHIINKLKLPNSQITPNNDFVNKVLKSIDEQRLVVLFSQEFTQIESEYHAIRESVKTKFKKNTYMVSVPSFTQDRAEYFGSIAKNCGINTEVKNVTDWQNAMHHKLKENYDEVMLFVTNLEDGDDRCNREFAFVLRGLNDNYKHLHILLIGRKKLAGLVYRKGELSPLESAEVHFFSSSQIKMKSENIVLQFEKMQKYREFICKLLTKEKIKRFSIWSSEEVINQFFWKNIFVRRGEHLVWRNQEVKEIGAEILECTNG